MTDSKYAFPPTPHVLTAAQNYLLLSIEALDYVCYIPGLCVGISWHINIVAYVLSHVKIYLESLQFYKNEGN